MTTDMSSVQQLPVSEVHEYIARTFFSKHFTVEGGVQRVVKALSAPLPSRQWHLGVTILDLIPTNDLNGRRQISIRMQRSDGEVVDTQPYDHIVFSTQTTQTSRMLKFYAAHLESHDADTKRCHEVFETLDQLHYGTSTVVCHTDTTLLPASRALWRDLNLVCPDKNETCTQNTMATHLIKCGTTKTIMQTTNPLPWLFPYEESVISKSTFERFVLTLAGRDARRKFFYHVGKIRPSHALEDSNNRLRLGPLQGRPHRIEANNTLELPGIWLNGSWSFGVPLLEGKLCSHPGCVSSARLVSTRLLELEGFSTAHLQKKRYPIIQ